MFGRFRAIGFASFICLPQQASDPRNTNVSVVLLSAHVSERQRSGLLPRRESAWRSGVPQRTELFLRDWHACKTSWQFSRAANGKCLSHRATEVTQRNKLSAPWGSGAHAGRRRVTALQGGINGRLMGRWPWGRSCVPSNKVQDETYDILAPGQGRGEQNERGRRVEDDVGNRQE